MFTLPVSPLHAHLLTNYSPSHTTSFVSLGRHWKLYTIRHKGNITHEYKHDKESSVECIKENCCLAMLVLIRMTVIVLVFKACFIIIFGMRRVIIKIDVFLLVGSMQQLVNLVNF